MTRAALLLLAGLAACATPPPPVAAGWIELFDGRSLGDWRPTRFGGEGEVAVMQRALHMGVGNPLTGVTWQGAPPSGDYELELTAARLAGNDFFCALTFPVDDAHLTIVLGGWGGSVNGLSCLDGRDADNNETRTLRGFRNGRDYHLRLCVTTGRVTAWLDGSPTPLLSADLSGRALTLRPEVELSRPLGIACFATEARISGMRWRAL